MIYAVAGLCWFIVISILSVILTFSDKKRARKGKWRIPEHTLFAAAILGGAIAMYITMRKINHKTRHKRFMIGLPVIIILQAALIGCLLYFNL